MNDENRSGEAPNREFPVDTLGIPILVDVVEASAPSSRFEPTPDGTLPAEDDAGDLILKGDFEATAAATDAGATQQDAPSATPGHEQLIDEISSAVSDEVVKKIKPLIRKRVRRALRAYEASRSQQADTQDAD